MRCGWASIIGVGNVVVVIVVVTNVAFIITIAIELVGIGVNWAVVRFIGNGIVVVIVVASIA